MCKLFWGYTGIFIYLLRQCATQFACPTTEKSAPCESYGSAQSTLQFHGTIKCKVNVKTHTRTRHIMCVGKHSEFYMCPIKIWGNKHLTANVPIKYQWYVSNVVVKGVYTRIAMSEISRS